MVAKVRRVVLERSANKVLVTVNMRMCCFHGGDEGKRYKKGSFQDESLGSSVLENTEQLPEAGKRALWVASSDGCQVNVYQ